MIHRFRSADHPAANGRQPETGEVSWTITAPLDGGDDYLELELGKKGREGVRNCLLQEEKDDSEARIAALEAENGKLRKVINELKVIVSWINYHDRIEAAEAALENSI